MSIQELLDILDRLNSLHLQLLELAEQKRAVLIANQVDALNLLVLKESKLVRQLTEIEKQRVDWIGEYLLKRGFRPDPRITITDLIKLLFRAEEKQALQEAQARMMETVRELKRKNEFNQELAEQSLAFVEYSLDLLGGPPEDDTVYRNPTGGHSAYKRSGLFDTRA